jgi:hypothetical protein
MDLLDWFGGGGDSGGGGIDLSSIFGGSSDSGVNFNVDSSSGGPPISTPSAPSLDFSGSGSGGNGNPGPDLWSQIFSSLKEPGLIKSLLPFAAGGAALGAGSLLGSSTGSALSSLSPTGKVAQTNALNAGSQPTDLATLLTQYSSLLSPSIQQTLDAERMKSRGLKESFVTAGVPASSAKADAIGRLQAQTNTGIAKAIADAVQGAQGSNQQAAINSFSTVGNQANQRNQLGVQGASAAGAGPMQALLLAALLGQKGGLLG